MNKYQQLADHLRTLLTTKAQLKSIVYGRNFKLNVAASYSLLSTCLNNMTEFRRFKDQVEAASKCQVGNPHLFWVMLAEYINTGAIKGGGKIKRMIVQNQKLLPQQLLNGRPKKMNKSRIQIRLLAGVKFPELARYQADPDVPNLYDLAYDEYSELRSQQPQLFAQPGVVVQSKSSCLPACVLFQGITDHLDSFGRFDIIDCCAAPGNKTMQLGEYLGQHGTVFAFDKDPKRAALLESRIQHQQFNNIRVSSQDFLTVVPNKIYSNVKMILADPSCSGSGMLTNFERDSTENSTNLHTSLREYEQAKWNGLTDHEQTRILNLQSFQHTILNHCAKFQALRIVYSTCSIYSQENEQVVEMFLRDNPSYCIKTIRGLSTTERGWGPIGQHCLRISPLSKKTDGFFVCLFRLRTH